MICMRKTVDPAAGTVPRTYQQGLEQEQAVINLGISRKTVWRDIHEARRKVANVLVYGKALEIGGCLRRQNRICPKMASITSTIPPQSTADRSPDDAGVE